MPIDRALLRRAALKFTVAEAIWKAVQYRAGPEEYRRDARVDYVEEEVQAPCGTAKVRLPVRMTSFGVFEDLGYGVYVAVERCLTGERLECRLDLVYVYHEEPKLEAYYLVPRWSQWAQWLCSPYKQYELAGACSITTIYEGGGRWVTIPCPKDPPFLVFDEPDAPERLVNYYVFPAGVKAYNVGPDEYALRVSGPPVPAVALMLVDKPGPARYPLGLPIFRQSVEAIRKAVAEGRPYVSFIRRDEAKRHEDHRRSRAEGSR